MTTLAMTLICALVDGGKTELSFGIPDQAFGAIVAAIIAGIVAWLGLIISKESKVSEFRQQWIDSLRADIAAVIRHGHCIYMSVAVAQNAPEHPWSRIGQDFAGLTEAAARIRLRINQKEQDSATLLSALNQHFADVKEMIRNDDDSDEASLSQAVSLASDKLVAAAQVVLKQEWRRVRSGELTYRIAKWAAVLFIIVSFAALVHHLFKL
jgi:hypothetical protein